MASFLRPAVVLCLLLAAGAPPRASRAAEPVVPAAPVPPMAAEVRAWLDGQGSPGFTTDDPRGAEVWAAVKAFYAARRDGPVWVSEGRPSRPALALLAALARSGDEGLDPARYDPRAYVGGDPQVLAASAGPSTALARLDVAITFTFLRAASDFHRGRLAPGHQAFWRASERPMDLAALLAEAAGTDRAVDVLRRLRPRHPQYRALSEALVHHREIAARGGWRALPSAKATLRPGSRGALVAALRERLMAGGDHPGPVPRDARLFDGALARAVQRFQRRHGLAPDGTVGRPTLEALNVPVEDRIRQLELNLERWRWLGFEPEGRSILVNIPTFELLAHDGGRPVLDMKVVVGSPESPTPVFAERMTTVVFRPHWNVPANIAELEILPAVTRDRRYLARNAMEMVRTAGGVRFRQRPGPGNSLGLVKFLFPNPFHVYLHDTPSRALFARPWRAFSHGCMRVEKPSELARFVLEGTPDGDPRAIRRAMQQGGERHVALRGPIPVSIVYFTAWAGEGGLVRFAPDVYGHDRQQGRWLIPPAVPPAARVASRS